MGFWGSYFLFMIVSVFVTLLGIYCVNQNKGVQISKADKEGVLVFMRFAFAGSFIPVFNVMVCALAAIAIVCVFAYRLTERVAKFGYKEEIEEKRKRW